jgi:hypothetical protein
LGRSGLARERRSCGAPQAWRRNHAERHRQGYTTDRVADVLRASAPVDDPCQHGGNTCARSESGRDALAHRLADPTKPGALTETVDLVDRAVATTAGAGSASIRGPIHASI